MRVALCLYGLIGGDQGKGGAGSSDKTLTTGHYYYDKNLFKQNDQVDVFVHTWSVDRKDDIEKMYKPKMSTYEHQIQFKIPSHVKGKPVRKNNHYSKWYSTMKSVELKRQYEEENNFKYDFVITSRFDIALNAPFDFSQYNPGKFYVGKWCAFFNKKGEDVFKGGRGPLYDLIEKGDSADNYKHQHYSPDEHGFIDQWFFSGSSSMDKFANLYNKLDKYTKPGNCSNDRAGTISNHRLSKYHVEQLGWAEKVEFVYHLHDEFPLVRRRFLGCKR